MRWWTLPCGCEATHTALIIAESCQLHRKLVPEDGLFLEGQYGPIEVPAAVGA